MILHPGIIALLLVSLLVTGMILYSSFFGVRIIAGWDIGSGSEGQLVLERRTYLISTFLAYALLFQISSFFLFIYTADSLHSLFTGAMCAAGTLNVDPYGYPTLLLKILNFILAGLWLIVNYADNQAYDYPLIRKKYGLLIVMAPLVATESVVQALYFLQMKADVITSCCGSLFSPYREGLSAAIVSIIPFKTAMTETLAQTLKTMPSTSALILSCCEGVFTGEALALIMTMVTALPVQTAMAGFYLAMGMTFFSGIFYLLRGKLGFLFSLAGGLFFLISCISFLSFISLYFYELPTHRCPFCVLQAEYGYVGYLLYASLLTGAVSGLGVGVLRPFAGIDSLAGSLPVLQKRLTLLCLVSYLLFAGLVIYRMVSTDFTLGVL